jgi:hypothetical protein
MRGDRIRRFEVQSEGPRKALILIAGDRAFKRVLEDAFGSIRFSAIFDDRRGRFDWGAYLYGVSKSDLGSIEALLTTLRHLVMLRDDLTQSFALDFHYRGGGQGVERTGIGQLIRRAKGYGRAPEDPSAAEEIALRMARFVQVHPSYRSAKLIVAIPPTQQTQADLAARLADRVASLMGIKRSRDVLVKRRATAAQKEMKTAREKVQNVRGAFAVSRPSSVSGRRIILVDDIYQSGATLNEAGRTLLEAGAGPTLGLTATKALRDVV